MSALCRSTCVLLCVFLLAACDDGSGQNPQADGASDGVGDGVGIDTGAPTGFGPCFAIATEDADGDGLLNGEEDVDFDCVQGPGETDWELADSDGDGLSDYDEDTDGSGGVDFGETDPLNSDSDGDGILDGDEPGSLVCRRSAVKTVQNGAAASTQTLLAAATDLDFSMIERADGLATFEVGDGLFGYVALRQTQQIVPEAERGTVLQDIALAGFSPGITLAEPSFMTWEFVHPTDPSLSFPPRPAARARVSLGVVSEPIDAVRDGLAAAVAGVATTPSNAPSTVCADEIEYWQTVTVRDNGTTAVVGVMGCASSFADTNTAFVAEDLTNTTMFALADRPRAYLPSDGECEHLATSLEPGIVDFLWVIDTSGSMSDEQDNVARAADLFFTTLVNSGTDWRLAVTTTETWALDYPAEVIDAELTLRDPVIDLESGLVGAGFLDATNPGAIDAFKEYVAVDRNCDRDPGGQNICGSGLESGLQSGLTVIDRSLADTRPNHRMRDDENVLKAVLWISDEEDQRFKDEFALDPWAADDPRRPAVLDSLIAPYQAHGVLGCAIVGDGEGGICPPLDISQSTVLGAQHGLGYIDVATATGGFWASICNESLEATINACVEAAVRTAASYQLSGAPLSATISVEVDGRVIPRARTGGWSYDAATNSVSLSGVALGQASAIAVSYREWRLDGA